VLVRSCHRIPAGFAVNRATDFAFVLHELEFVPLVDRKRRRGAAEPDAVGERILAAEGGANIVPHVVSFHGRIPSGSCARSRVDGLHDAGSLLGIMAMKSSRVMPEAWIISRASPFGLRVFHSN